jgi:AraC family transcriptional regulator
MVIGLPAHSNSDRARGSKHFYPARDRANGATALSGFHLLGRLPRKLRRIRDFVHAKMEDELGLDEMAQSVGLSTAHFARMFRKSTGETPHQFVLRQRLERAKAMLRVPDARVLDVAVACGFKTQQHFAQVFRDVCGINPTGYRRIFWVSKPLAA